MNEPEINAVLGQLRDLQLPVSVSWWPLAIGWWVLIALVIGAVSCVFYTLFKKLQPATLTDATIAQLDDSLQQLQSSGDAAEYLNDLNIELKQFCIKRSGRTPTASLTGLHWINWLNAHSDVQLSAQTSDALIQQSYQSRPDIDAPSIHQELVDWVKRSSARSIQNQVKLPINVPGNVPGNVPVRVEDSH